MNITRPIMTFDLGCAVHDIEWAPYSSTVFAAVNSSGMLYVYDLHQEKHTHLCEQQAVKRARALHITFNSIDPIILVGDDKGGVNSFKLCASLCKGPLEYIPNKDEVKDEKTVYPTSQELEQGKMESFLDSLDKHVY